MNTISTITCLGVGNSWLIFSGELGMLRGVNGLEQKILPMPMYPVYSNPHYQARSFF